MPAKVSQESRLIEIIRKSLPILDCADHANGQPNDCANCALASEAHAAVTEYDLVAALKRGDTVPDVFDGILIEF